MIVPFPDLCLLVPFYTSIKKVQVGKDQEDCSVFILKSARRCEIT